MESLFDTPATAETKAPDHPPEMPAAPTVVTTAAPAVSNAVRICATCRYGMCWGGVDDTPAGWVCYGREFANQDRGEPPAVDPNAALPCWQ